MKMKNLTLDIEEMYYVTNMSSWQVAKETNIPLNVIEKMLGDYPENYETSEEKLCVKVY